MISKGGINRNWKGNATDAWWYIDPNNRINYEYSLPEGYTENTSFEAPKEQPIEELEFQKEVEEYAGICVHCRTQEQWDKVLNFYPNIARMYKNNHSGWKEYKENTTLTIEGTYTGGYADVEFDTKENYNVLSFEEWCTQNNVDSRPQQEVSTLALSEKVKEWVEKVKPLQLSLEELGEYINMSITTPMEIYSLLPGNLSEDKARNLLSEWATESMCVGTNETFPKASKVEGYSVDNSNPLFPKIKFN